MSFSWAIISNLKIMEQKINTFTQKLIKGYSIEVTPRSASNIESFKDVLPQNTRVYIAHIENEDIQSMVNTCLLYTSDAADE